MRFGSVCSGIEAASVAWEPLGWTAAWVSEIEAFPSAVLAHHWPDVPNLGDMLALPALMDAGEIEAPDVLVGGTPCQAFSVAGNRESLADARGGLTLAYVELADAIDRKRSERGEEPCIVAWENVPGVLSTKDNAFGCFLAGLAGEDEPLLPPGKRWTNAGVVLGPKRAIAWRILDAQYFGLAQRRRRVFVVASARDGFDPSQVLLEFEGVRRDSAPRRETRQETAGDAGPGFEVAGTLDSRVSGGGFPGSDGAMGGHVIPTPYHEVAHCLNAGGMGRIDYETESFVVNAVSTGGDIAHTLNTANNGKGCSEDGTGRGVPTIAFHSNAQAAQLPTETQDTSVSAPLTRSQQAAVAHPVRTVALRGREGGATAEVGGEVATALRASSGGGDKPHVLHMMAVRRLTPTECEFLQGFPRNHTLIPYGRTLKGEAKEDLARYFERTGQFMRESDDGAYFFDRAAFEKAWPAMVADGPRYKSIGNSMAVPCMRFIGSRIQRHLDGDL